MIIRMHVRFLLKRQKKAGSRIIMRVSFMSHRMEFQTGIEVGDRNFNLSAQKVVGMGKGNLPVELYNRELARMRLAVGRVFFAYNMLGIEPEPDDIRKDFNFLTRPIKRSGIKGPLPLFQPSDAGNNEDTRRNLAFDRNKSLRSKRKKPSMKAENSLETFFRNCYDEFVREQAKLRDWTDATKEKFKALRNHLMDFDSKLTFDYFDGDGIANFIRYLEKDRGMLNSTVGKQLDFLRSFLRWSHGKGYCRDNAFERYRPKLKSVRKPVVFLDKDELKKLEEYKVPTGREALNYVRDVFLFCCYTGLRYSDVAKLTWDDIHDHKIEIVTQKTSDRLFIDFNRKSKSLIDKYSKCHYEGKKVFPVISNQKMNAHLKELCMLAGIDTPVKYTFFKGKERIEKVRSKYQVIGTQAGRRSFICSAIACGIPPDVIMKWTGHSDYKTMKPYIDVSDNTTASYMKRFDMPEKG